MFNAKILKGMFHEFYNKADVIIADFPLSTAFIEALQYGLPTVLIDLSIVKISNKAKKMLSKRCPIVDGSIDCNGRVDIDFNAIKSSILNASSKVTDTSFLDYYAPSNVKVK